MKEKTKYIEAIIDHAGDEDYIYTPLDLCDEMVSSITKLEGDILVVRNLEFIYTLYQKKVDMNTVHYSTNCDIKKQVAIQLGLDINNIYELDYNSKEINLGTEEDMKFDVIIQNPPYSNDKGYNFYYKSFIEKSIDLLNDGGKLVAIHPDSWRNSNKLKKFAKNIKEHLVELHLKGYDAFDVGTSVDWYLYSKTKTSSTKVYYKNGDIDDINLSNKEILSFSSNSIPAKIISKITKENYHNGIIRPKTFFNPPEHSYKGKYKQCGGRQNKEYKLNATSWVNNIFAYTNEPVKHQFDNKVVMSYIRKPRARYFNDNTGSLLAYYWLEDEINCNPESLVILLNSKMLWKIHLELINNDNSEKYIRPWFLQSLNFENLDVKTEDELYEHYNLTEEEIAWIENN